MTAPLKKTHVTLLRGPIVSTRRSINNEATPAMGLACLGGAVAREGYPFQWVDGIGEGINHFWFPPGYPHHVCQGLTFDEILGRIPLHTRVIAFSAMFSGEWPISRDLLLRLRAAFGKALIVAGGEHVTAMTEYTLRDCAALDLCVRGEGEGPLLDLLADVEAGGDGRRVAGCAYVDAEGNYRENGPVRRIQDLNQLPRPWWPEGYLNRFWEAGKAFGVLTQRDMPMMISRGCPFQCTFCSSPRMWTTRYGLRDVAEVLRETREYIEKYNITAVQLYDLTAIVKKRWIVEFCQGLIREGINIKWSLPSGTRSEALDEESLGLLKQVGCNYLVYAPESGSAETLERIKKRLDLQRLTRSVQTAVRLGINVRVNLMIGLPGETRFQVFRTLVYGMKLAWMGAAEVSLQLFSPYPGSELFDRLLEQGRLQVGDDYFLSITSIFSDYLTPPQFRTNETMGPVELSAYRLFFLLSYYVIGYLRYPGRIVRTFRNIQTGQQMATVFEHRLADMINRWRKR
ncbi:MAG: B12-binding domain-containing radical SAM protein [Magnetococcus sp. WYHC-3]